MKLLTLVFLMLILAGACGNPSTVVDKSNASEVLTIYPDGTMEYRNRIMNEDEVVIYSDGTGGERAAVRVWTPLRPRVREDNVFYRDTIIVDRVDSNKEK